MPTTHQANADKQFSINYKEYKKLMIYHLKGFHLRNDETKKQMDLERIDHRRRIKTEESKGRPFCQGDRIDLIHCGASYFTPG